MRVGAALPVSSLSNPEVFLSLKDHRQISLLLSFLSGALLENGQDFKICLPPPLPVPIIPSVPEMLARAGVW